MNYGWTVDHCLDMPATRFFAMAKAGRELYQERMNHLLLELCDIAPCGTGSAEYHKELRKVYLDRLIPSAIKPKAPYYDIKDPAQGKALEKKLTAAMKGLFGG